VGLGVHRRNKVREESLNALTARYLQLGVEWMAAARRGGCGGLQAIVSDVVMLEGRGVRHTSGPMEFSSHGQARWEEEETK